MRAAIFFLGGCSADLLAGSGVAAFFTMLSCMQSHVHWLIERLSVYMRNFNRLVAVARHYHPV